MKKSEISKTSHAEEDELADVPIYAAEEDANGLYHVMCNKTGFELFLKFLDENETNVNETDLNNPYCQ